MSSPADLSTIVTQSYGVTGEVSSDKEALLLQVVFPERRSLTFQLLRRRGTNPKNRSRPSVKSREPSTKNCAIGMRANKSIEGQLQLHCS